MKTVKHTLTSNYMKYVAAVMAAAPLLASTSVKADAPPVTEEETPFVTGTLSLMVDTHFVSYGFDVWGAGENWDDPLFHPMLELNFDLGEGFKGILGTWWDVNNNQDTDATSIGNNKIQEVDVWAGVGYSMGDWSFTALYQEWMFAGQSERIVDLKAGYAHFLNPSLTLHFRVDNDLGLDNGLATVLGIAPGTSWEDISFSFPVNVAFETDGFHGGDSGWSFASVGASASVPLKFIPKGDWTFSAGLTYYFTSEDVIPSNAINGEENFLTGTAGVVLTF